MGAFEVTSYLQPGGGGARTAQLGGSSPPSALPGISPTRGEIGGGGACAFASPQRKPQGFEQGIKNRRSFRTRSISPLVGEMPAGREGRREVPRPQFGPFLTDTTNRP